MPQRYCSAEPLAKIVLRRTKNRDQGHAQTEAQVQYGRKDCCVLNTVAFSAFDLVNL